MKLRFNGGFSLVEVIVSFGVLSIILGALFMTLLAGNNSFRINDAVIKAQSSVRKSIAYVSRDFREASALIVSGDTNSTDVSFFQDGIGNVSYIWANSGSDANRIIRVRPTNTMIIATDISNFTVVDGVDDITIRISSAVSDSNGIIDTFSLNTKITKR